MRVLVLENTAELAELMGLYLSSLSSAEVTATYQLDHASQLLNTEKIDVLILNQQFLETFKLDPYKNWRNKNPETALVLIGEKATDQEGVSYFIHSLYLVQETKDMLKASFWRRLAGKPSELPLPISAYLVYRLGVCPADLFLKLGEDNWAKIFHKGSLFGEEEQKKFETKKVKQFYIFAQDVQVALEHFEDLLSSLKASSDVQSITLVPDAVEFIFHTLKENSFNGPLKKVAEAAIRHSLALVRTEPALKNYVDKIFRPEHSWMVRHSLVITHVACGLATQLGWTSEQTYIKIATAALLHDMTLPRLDQDEETWMINMSHLKPNEELDQEMKQFLQHPFDGAEMVRRHKSIPPDTDKILLEHHELPDGTGFPRALTATHISPLGSVFILSHAIATILLHEQDSRLWSMEMVKDRLGEKRWDSAHFKKAMQALEKSEFFA
jgi:HD-GYP domain-containing protein (c-di-GMP phosphodiesterase class II)